MKPDPTHIYYGTNLVSQILKPIIVWIGYGGRQLMCQLDIRIQDPW